MTIGAVMPAVAVGQRMKCQPGCACLRTLFHQGERGETAVVFDLVLIGLG